MVFNQIITTKGLFMNYIDHYGRMHDKPVTVKELVPSNNGWIYSAYFVKGGGSLDMDKLQKTFCDSVHRREDGGVFTTRHPKGLYTNVPQSRDELLGMAYLGFLKPHHLNGWNFSPYPLPKFNLLKFIEQALEAYDKHRNYFWKNNLGQLYHVAFSVPIQDRAFMLECWKETKTIRYYFYKTIANLDKFFTTPKNGVQWLKYGGEERKAIMKEEFDTNHPLRNI